MTSNHVPEIVLSDPIVREAVIDNELIRITTHCNAWTDGVRRGMTTSNIARPMIMVHRDNDRCRAFRWCPVEAERAFDEEAWIREGTIRSDAR